MGSFLAISLLALLPAATPLQGVLDFETPAQAAWQFSIETGKGALHSSLAGPEAGPHSGKHCLRIDFRFGGATENHLKLEYHLPVGAWNLNDYVGLELWVKPVKGAARVLTLSHWFNDGGHWWHYRTTGWDDLRDGVWQRLTLSFADGVDYYGPDASYDPARATQFILNLMSRPGEETASGTIYIDDLRLIPKPTAKPFYQPQVGVWFVTAFDPVHGANGVLDWRLPKMFGLRPLVGYYDSSDPKVIAWQLAAMRRGGIDFVVIDVSPLDPLPRQVLAVLKQLRAQPAGAARLKYCFQIETYGQTPSPVTLRSAADRILKACGKDPLYLRYKGKPLLIPFAPGEVKEGKRWTDDRFTVRWISSAPGDWRYYENYPQTVNRECMCVSPGACNLLEYLSAPQVVGTIFSTPRDGVAYLAKELKWALDNQPDLIFLSSWNDWAFGNTLEPSDEYGYQPLDLIREMLAISSATRRNH